MLCMNKEYDYRYEHVGGQRRWREKSALGNNKALLEQFTVSLCLTNILLTLPLGYENVLSDCSLNV